MTREDTLKVLHKFKQERGEQYKIVEIGIFGSVARDEASQGSDVDIVFRTDHPNLFRTASMKVELESLLARQVDLVRLRETMNPNLKRRIQEEAQFV